MLTSELAPVAGNMGRYAREIASASAATDFGANVTVIAPDYARDTATLDRSLSFEVRRFRGGLQRCVAETYGLSRSRKQTVDNISDGLLTETAPSRIYAAS